MRPKTLAGDHCGCASDQSHRAAIDNKCHLKLHGYASHERGLSACRRRRSLGIYCNNACPYNPSSSGNPKTPELLIHQCYLLNFVRRPDSSAHLHHGHFGEGITKYHFSRGKYSPRNSRILPLFNSHPSPASARFLCGCYYLLGIIALCRTAGADLKKKEGAVLAIGRPYAIDILAAL
jgi:hypothetical protein